jgi:hypothetical protein
MNKFLFVLYSEICLPLWAVAPTGQYKRRKNPPVIQSNERKHKNKGNICY